MLTIQQAQLFRLFLPLLFLTMACASSSKIHSMLDPEEDQDLEIIAVLGINDLHGALLERKSEIPVSHHFGGGSILAGHINLLRQEFGKNLLVFDAGDQSQGSLEGHLLGAEATIDFLNRIEINASGVGPQELDLSEDQIEKAQYPYIATNVEGVPGSYSSATIQVGEIKVGLLGILEETRATDEQKKKNPNLRIEESRRLILKEAAHLRQIGADAVILLAHGQIDCEIDHRFSLSNEIRKKPSIKTTCTSTGKTGKILASLPSGTLDLVVSAGDHRMYHHWLNDIPIIQSGAAGVYYHLAYLPFDKKTKRLLGQRVLLEGPVPVCRKWFAQTQNCDAGSFFASQKDFELVDSEMHGRTIDADPDVERVLLQYENSMRSKSQTVVGKAAQKIRHDPLRESEFLNWVADTIRAETGADFSLVNPGAIRNSIDQGPITYGEFFRAVPYNSRIVTIDVTGYELKRILRVANSGARGFFGVSGLQLRLLGIGSRAKARDLNHDGKIQHWEVDRLVRVRTESGKRIISNKMYRLATTEFLAKGGDDLAWPISKIPAHRFKLSENKGLRDLLLASLAKNGPVNSTNSPLVRENRPRILLRNRR